MLIFILGFLFGVLISAVTVRHFQIGVLRVDNSDPYDVPYLFLELDKKPVNIMSKRYVLLKVKLDDYLPRR